MSSPVVQIRSRAHSVGQAAVSRARLRVVPVARPRAPKVPFVALVSLLLLTGVIGLLMFNTSMQQASFHANRLEEQATVLAARQQTLEMELDHLRNPQRLAAQAQRMGMVLPSAPAFLSLEGEVVGTPRPAARDDALRLNPRPPAVPSELRAGVAVLPADDGAPEPTAR